jgi:hypothetical protein
MTTTTYTSWALHHANLFGLSGDADLTALKSWEPHLTASYSTAQLEAATELMLARFEEFAKYAGEVTKSTGKQGGHLAALRRALREIASKEAGQTRSALLGTCGTCNGCGLVSVPYPQNALGKNYTLAVWCSCALGRWKRDRFRPRKDAGTRRPLSLEEYERMWPGWRKRGSHER